MKKQKWTIAGIPLSEKQVTAIKQAKAEDQTRIVITPNPRQSAAVLRAAAEAETELREIAASLSERPKFSITIELRRKQLEMTLEQLAEITGISKANLSRLERGRTTNPTLDTLRRIGDGLGLELSVDYQAAG